ncbi:MAG: hypothetical protein ACE5DY_04085 [Mariprofundaceae bacterium]
MTPFLVPASLLGFSIIGIILSLLIGGVITQPDWSLSILLAAMLAHRGSWLWALPGVLLHDIALYWTVFGVLPVVAFLPMMLIYTDQQLGPALPQRIVLMLFSCLPILWLGADVFQWLLTALLCIPLWYLLVMWYGQAA